MVELSDSFGAANRYRDGIFALQGLDNIAQGKFAAANAALGWRSHITREPCKGWTGVR